MNIVETALCARIGLVAIDGRRPIPMLCHVRSDGDVIIPTGHGHPLIDDPEQQTLRIDFSAEPDSVMVVRGDYAPWRLRPTVASGVQAFMVM